MDVCMLYRGCVIICKIIVQLLVIARNIKKTPGTCNKIKKMQTRGVCFQNDMSRGELRGMAVSCSSYRMRHGVRHRRSSVQRCSKIHNRRQQSFSKFPHNYKSLKQ